MAASFTGATDEIGFKAVEHRHYVTDLQATILHQMGLDDKKWKWSLTAAPST